MKQLLFTIWFFFATFFANSAHIVGGDIYYDYLGNNTYRFYITIYRDCLSTGADFDTDLPLGVFLTNTNTRIMDVTVPFPGRETLPVTFNNPCVTPPTNICTERAVYVRDITLPPTPGGYTISYQRCCRGPNINNLINPDDTGLTLTVLVPGNENGNYVNSSARFDNYPPLLLCNNDDLFFDHSATDPDGDQLVYSLATPNAGASPFNPAPNPIPAPPYSPVIWSSGHNAVTPLGPGSQIAIDPTTGVLTASPNLVGRYVVGIRVEEYRNGQLINVTIRDFIFRVFNCNISMQAILPTQEELATFEGYCNGLTIDFENNSYGGTNYQWDFGDPTTTSDNSTLFEPSYTYPDTGYYQAQLIVNPGWNCTDTALIDIYVYNEFNTSFTGDDSICFIDNSFDFVATSEHSSSATYNWDFGGQSDPLTATGQIQNDIHFTSPGEHIITLDATFSLCEAEYIDTVYVISQPEANFEMPFNYECEGLTVNFINTTTNATFYNWDFDWNNQQSNEFEPSFTFPAGGTYDVQLITGSSSVCIDTLVQTVTVNELMTVSFTHSPDQCITSNSFNFDGTVSGPPNATYTWNFGPDASVGTSNQVDVNGVSFTTTGSIPISLTGAFDNCTTTATSEIYIYTEPTIDFTIEPAQQCAPYQAQFINLSSSETPMNFSWDFGDESGLTNEIHPTHTFDTPGQYPITLTLWTDSGCIDTLTLERSDLVHVFPTPVADFDVSSEETHICDANILFTNKSIDATSYYYFFDDQTAHSSESDPYYTYINSGTHHPYLIASNEEGCADTTSARIFIEPFSIFAPNTFTPDGDEFNNTFTPKMWVAPVEWHLTIYNRWGEVIFESFDYSMGWDGTYNGRLVQNGTYTYTINYKPCTVEFTEIETHGYVNLLR